MTWAREMTIAHAGRTLRLYVPLYLSSYCINHCLYCAFRYPHPLQRDHLSEQTALAQADILGGAGSSICCWLPAISPG